MPIGEEDKFDWEKFESLRPGLKKRRKQKRLDSRIHNETSTGRITRSKVRNPQKKGTKKRRLRQQSFKTKRPKNPQQVNTSLPKCSTANTPTVNAQTQTDNSRFTHTLSYSITTKSDMPSIFGKGYTQASDAAAKASDLESSDSD